MIDPSTARCPGPGDKLGGLCMNRLPCAEHGITDAEQAIERWGFVYEQREGELHLHVHPEVPDV